MAAEAKMNRIRMTFTNDIFRDIIFESYILFDENPSRYNRKMQHGNGYLFLNLERT